MAGVRFDSTDINFILKFNRLSSCLERPCRAQLLRWLWVEVNA